MDTNCQALLEAFDVVGGLEPSKFVCPPSMVFIGAPPPLGKDVLTRLLIQEHDAALHLGFKNIPDSGFQRCISITSNSFSDALDIAEDYHELFIASNDGSVLAHLEYWEDLALVFSKKAVAAVKTKDLASTFRAYVRNRAEQDSAYEADWLNLLRLSERVP